MFAHFKLPLEKKNLLSTHASKSNHQAVESDRIHQTIIGLKTRMKNNQTRENFSSLVTIEEEMSKSFIFTCCSQTCYWNWIENCGNVVKCKHNYFHFLRRITSIAIGHSIIHSLTLFYCLKVLKHFKYFFMLLLGKEKGAKIFSYVIIITMVSQN